MEEEEKGVFVEGIGKGGSMGEVRGKVEVEIGDGIEGRGKVGVVFELRGDLECVGV